MKKWFWTTMALAVAALAYFAARPSTRTPDPVADKSAPAGSGYADFIGGNKVFAVLSGDIFESVARQKGWCDAPAIYQSVNEMAEAVRLGRADAAMMSEDAVPALVESGVYGDDLTFLPVPREVLEIHCSPVFHDPDLARRFNAFLAGLIADGTLEEMNRRYLDGLPRREDIPVIELTGENGVLKAADTGNYPPISYVGDNGELLGYGTELARRFARHLGMDLRIDLMAYEGVLPSVVSGKTDMSSCFYVITEERKEGAIFGDPVTRLGTVLAVKKTTEADASADRPKQSARSAASLPDQAGSDAPRVEGQAAEVAAKQPAADASPTYKDFMGKILAVKNGTIYDGISRDFMRSSSTLLFEDYPSIYEAVVKGKADAGMRGYIAAHVSLFEPEYRNLALVALPGERFSLPIGAISMNPEVIGQFNAFLAAIRANGVYDEMHERWLADFDPANIPAMPDIPLPGGNGVVTVAISSDYMPFSFLGDNGINMGFDIELARRFAAHAGKSIVFVDMAFSGLLPYVVSGKADLAVSDITITAERRKSVLFTEPYFFDASAVIYRKGSNAAAAGAQAGEIGQRTGFLSWLKTAIQRNLIIENRWKMIVGGLGVSLAISFLAQMLGTVLGCLLCWALTRKNRLVNGLGRFYSGLIHGLPMVVLLMISYYIIFGKTDVPALLIAVCAFSLVEATSIAANLKGAIETVDIVEIEAARSIGFTAFGAFRTVTLPQAVRRALPAYCNGFVQLVKATAIVGYIAIQDLTRAGDIIRSRTYDAYFPLLLVAVIYLLVTTACIQLFKFAVGKINGSATP